MKKKKIRVKKAWLGVKFINVFTCSFYMCRSQKFKKDSQVMQLFAILGSVCLKLCVNTLMKSTLGLGSNTVELNSVSVFLLFFNAKFVNINIHCIKMMRTTNFLLSRVDVYPSKVSTKTTRMLFKLYTWLSTFLPPVRDPQLQCSGYQRFGQANFCYYFLGCFKIL